MKVKLHKRDGVQIVRVSLGFGEKVERRVLDRVRLCGEPCFAPITTDLRMGDVRELNYSFSGLQSVKDFLATTITSSSYETMLIQLAVAFVTCHIHGLDPKRLLLNTRFVFADKDALLHFAYLPLNKFEAKGQMSLKWFLEELSFSKIDIQGEEGAQLRQALVRYVHDTGARINPDKYCVMLASSLKLALPRDVADYIHSIDPSLTVRVSADNSRYGRQGRGPQQGGAKPDIRTVIWEGRSNRRVPTDEDQRHVVERPVEKTVRKPMVQPWDSSHPKDSPTFSNQPASKEEAEKTGREVYATCAHALHRIRTGKLYSLYDGQAVQVGRGSSCDIQLLGNDRLSRTHARLSCDVSGIRITDLGSSNGTVVGGKKLDANETIAIGYGTRFYMAGEEFEAIVL